MQKGSNPEASVPLEDIEEAGCPLWFLKTIEKFLLREFFKQTLQEFNEIFSVILEKVPQAEMFDVRPNLKKQTSTDLESLYLFLGDMITPVNKICVEYLTKN